MQPLGFEGLERSSVSLFSLPAELAGSEGCLAGPEGGAGGAGEGERWAEQSEQPAKTPEKGHKVLQQHCRCRLRARLSALS